MEIDAQRLFRETQEDGPGPSPGRRALDWVQVAPEAPYFMTEGGEDWAPIGQNDAITWPELAPLFRRRDPGLVEGHLRWLAGHGVTCLRVMLEYAQMRHRRYRYLERPPGHFVPSMVQFWDDLFAACERTGVRILVTPFDTFWTWRHWRHHPYNRANGGPLDHPSRLLLCGETRARIRDRLEFAVRRWGGSPALFAWDLWNEIHPSQAGESVACFGEFIHDLAGHVSRLERLYHGRTHPKTVSLFGPELVWRPHLPMAEPIFRHPDLDFATIHVYETGTIDHPRDTIAPALAMGRIVRASLAETPPLRPFLDSEHGPIHTFKDHHKTLPEAFDDEYFRHMQWAHVAAGAAGGGMRWPNRHPHVLTPGMRRAQRALAGFLPLVDWQRFRRRNLSAEVALSTAQLAAVACGDDSQAILWVVRTDVTGADGLLRRDALPLRGGSIGVPGLRPGTYRAAFWDTTKGIPTGQVVLHHAPDQSLLQVPLPDLTADLGIALRPVSPDLGPGGPLGQRSGKSGSGTTSRALC